MEQSCLFCLEVIKEPPLSNPVGCECKIQTHTTCIEKWFQEKQQLECPICHKSPADNMIISMPIQNMLQTVQMTHVDLREARNRKHTRIIGLCACLSLGWGLGFLIIDILLRK